MNKKNNKFFFVILLVNASKYTCMCTFVFEYKINMHSASTYYVNANFYSGFDSLNVLQSVQYIAFF